MKTNRGVARYRSASGLARHNSISGLAHLFLLFVVILVAIGAIGYLAYQNAQLKKQTSTTPTEKTISEWETYENEALNISFRYPKDWKLKEVEGEKYIIIESPDLIQEEPFLIVTSGVKMRFSILPWGYSGDISSLQHELGPTNGDVTILEQEIIDLNDMEAVKTISDSPGGVYTGISIPEATNTKVYSISYPNADDSWDNVINQIISSFKFIDPDFAKPTGSTCKSVNLSMSVAMPNKNWECSVDNMGKEQKGWDGMITAKSNTFDIVISSLGRGPFCSDLSESCLINPFYSNKNVSLKIYILDEEYREIFGPTTNNRALVSIKWEGMEQDMEHGSFTTSERDELYTLLDFISLE